MSHNEAQAALLIIFKITLDNMISRFCGACETVELLSFKAKGGQAKYEDIHLHFQLNFELKFLN